MPTQLTPDEEFDAHFRQGLEHYPELPEDPAAWQRMALLLDAQLRQQALRRKVLRLLGGELALLLLGVWALVHWAPTASQLPALAKASPTTETRLAATPTGQTPATARLASLPLASSGSTTQKPARTPVATEKLALAYPTTATNTRTVASKLLADNQPKNVALLAQTKASHRPEAAELALTPVARQRAIIRQAQRLEVPTTRLSLASRSDAATTVAFGPSRRRAGYLAAKKTVMLTDKLLASGQYVRHPAARMLDTDAGLMTPKKQLPPRLSRQRKVELAQQTLSVTANAAASATPSRLGTELPEAVDMLAARRSGSLGYLPLPAPLAPVQLAAITKPVDSVAKPQPLRQAYRLRLGLVAAPELSTVRADHLSAPGEGGGLQLEYQLTKRLRLNTSYLLTVKRYVARGTDYHLPAGYTLPHNWVISDVDAVCRIVDIPINLRYDVWQRPSYQIFTSVGLSSLLMRREQYTYGYEPVAGQPVAPYSWELDNGSQHVLKILNLSAGYERAVGPRWSVQAEPYLKLPLGGVGFGTVRLTSAGIFFSLKYGLLPVRTAAP